MGSPPPIPAPGTTAFDVLELGAQRLAAPSTSALTVNYVANFIGGDAKDSSDAVNLTKNLYYGSVRARAAVPRRASTSSQESQKRHQAPTVARIAFRSRRDRMNRSLRAFRWLRSRSRGCRAAAPTRPRPGAAPAGGPPSPSPAPPRCSRSPRNGPRSYAREAPGAQINVQGGGSTAGVKAAQTGAAQIGTVSRELKADEARPARRSSSRATASR